MRIITYLISLLLLVACAKTSQKEPLALWYDEPARNWDEALPVGNGRSGAMVFGGIAKEQLQLNENIIQRGTVGRFQRRKNHAGNVRQSSRADESRKIYGSFRPGL